MTLQSEALVARMEPGDLFMISDVDEIPSRAALALLRDCDWYGCINCL